MIGCLNDGRSGALKLDRRRKGQPSNGIVNKEKMNVNVHNIVAAMAEFQRLCVCGPRTNAGHIHRDAGLCRQCWVHSAFLQHLPSASPIPPFPMLLFTMLLFTIFPTPFPMPPFHMLCFLNPHAPLPHTSFPPSPMLLFSTSPPSPLSSLLQFSTLDLADSSVFKNAPISAVHDHSGISNFPQLHSNIPISLFPLCSGHVSSTSTAKSRTTFRPTPFHSIHSCSTSLQLVSFLFQLLVCIFMFLCFCFTIQCKNPV